ncbi:MAG: 4Fe-4S dicluster domain-containing protein [Gammaproteobacteria bacterium]|nr:4Fe-4S dicluster domain-containing protein [Gammaproteobacteria bacterium]NIR97052.1 4Fe-4S dicluster domain-containing protein [Gammaproteobacteria bacterium]NIT62750.1 4Fe-4S dicluster domain-containing protein [Gammaproteobacteria bacterium]NIV19708.1 4Fe-4S dicluster domain-containing protein [Gammaproteobacteria bacterium]NIY31330.1 4Fe-4S dicluster domain-containing protein [Gammaproteobacteria bacterium]
MSEELRLSARETRGKPGVRRYAMVIDLRRCIGCDACMVACKAEFDVPLGVFRTWVPYRVVGKYPTVKKQFLPRLCNHCDDPPCVRACPVGATYKVEDGGFVLQRYDRCIGCKACMASCPYNARFMLPEHRSRSRITSVVDKCTFCHHRVVQGLVPACVQTCIGRARVFGDLNDPNSEVSRLVARHATQVLRPEQGTKPHVFYIGADRNQTEYGRAVYDTREALDDERAVFNRNHPI